MSRRAAILGLGSRGLTLAGACEAAGWRVRGFDPDPLAGQAGWSRDWRREERISGTVAGVDWVFCCLPERLELLQTVIRRAQAEAPRGALIAVSSQNFDVDTLQSCAVRPEQVVRLSASPDGGVAIDLSDRNPSDVRVAVEAGVAELAAILSLSPPGDPDDQLGDAESA